MKLYFKNFEIYHNISFLLLSWSGQGSAEHRLGTSALQKHSKTVLWDWLYGYYMQTPT